MNSFIRIALLGVFIALGIGIAICVAYNSPEPENDSVATNHSGNIGLANPSADDFSAKRSSLQMQPHAAVSQDANQPQVTAENFKDLLDTKNLMQTLKNLSEAVNKTQQSGDSNQSGGISLPFPTLDQIPGVNSSDSTTPSPNTSLPVKKEIKKSTGEGENGLTINFQNTEIREVLEMLSQQGDLNILASKSVSGTVSATITGVDVETALAAILKSTGYTWRKEGKFIYVGTEKDFTAIEHSMDRINTRMYMPNYVTAAEISRLLTPLMTTNIGTISVSSQASGGIAIDGTNAGGDDYAGNEVVIIRDYEAVLTMMDKIVQQYDQRPVQVAIEAMILSVTLDDTNKFGVDFEVLRNKNNAVLASGSPLSSLGSLSFTEGGLKFGFLDSSLSTFVSALETVGDTDIIATPRLSTLNKQRAEIHIGEKLGYIQTTQSETTSTQAVEFLDVGTQLRIRPFVSSDGMIRMEVHPELSDGFVKVVDGFTLPESTVTEVTTNVMAKDGSTVVIGGLIREEIIKTATQIPLLGSLPFVGYAFKTTTDSVKRTEIIVLITARIVYEPYSAKRGDKAASEFHHRHAVLFDKANPLGKRYVGQRYFHAAQKAWHFGKQKKALRLINMAIHFDPHRRTAISLRSDIVAGVPRGDHTDVSPPRIGPADYPLDGPRLFPNLLQNISPRPNSGFQYVPLHLQKGQKHPVNRGKKGPIHYISPVRY